MSDWLRSEETLRDVAPRYGLLLDDLRVPDSTDCHYEACIPLPEDIGHLPWGFRIKRLPYGAYARTPHIGGHVGFALTFSTLRNE